MNETKSIVGKAESTWDDLCDLWKRRKILCVIIFVILCVPTLFSIYQQFRAVPKLENELNRLKSEIKSNESQIDNLIRERDNLSLKLTTIQTIANRTFPNEKEPERLGLLLSQLNRSSETYSIKSENQIGGITAGKVQIDVNPKKPLLVQDKNKTKVEFKNNIYEKKYYFRNPEGRNLQNVILKVTFDQDFISVKADKWVWTGMISSGGEKTQFDQNGRIMAFYTDILEAIAYIEVTVNSKYDIQINHFDFSEQ